MSGADIVLYALITLGGVAYFGVFACLFMGLRAAIAFCEEGRGA